MYTYQASGTRQQQQTDTAASGRAATTAYVLVLLLLASVFTVKQISGTMRIVDYQIQQ